MARILGILAVCLATLAFALGVVGCSSSTPSAAPRATATDKMGADKMGADKMGADKMGADKMDKGKMGSDKMEKK